MDMHTQIIRQLMHNKKYDAVTEFAKINSSDRDEVILVREYAGDCARLLKRDNEIYILCPKEMDIVQEEGIADSIANGTIFDDASLLEDQSDYMQKTILPMAAISNKHGIEPKKIKVMITGVMGRINDGGNIEFVKYEDNIVYIKLLGACANCQMIDLTLKDGIASAIMNEVPAVKDVINLDDSIETLTN